MPTKASKNLKVSNAKMLKELNESYESNEFEQLLTTEQKNAWIFDLLQDIRIQRKNPYAIPEKLDNMEADLKSRQVIEPPKELDPEIKKARERFKNGETNANLRKLGISWAPGLPEPTNNDVRRMLNCGHMRY